VVVAIFALTARLGWLINTHAVNVVFWDQWDFFTPEFEGQNLFAKFVHQHGPHRQGLGGWLMPMVHAATDWDGRAEAYVSVALMVASTALALLLIFRLHGALEPFDIAVPALLLTVHAFEQYVGTTNFSHGPLPVLLSVAFALSLTMHTESQRLAAMCLLCFCAVYTGFGIFLGILGPLVVGLQLWFGRTDAPRARRLGIALATMIASLASFWVGWTPSSAAACFHFPHEQPTDYLRFAGRMAARVLGGTGDGGIRVPIGIGLVLAQLGTNAWAVRRMIRSAGADTHATAIFCLTGFSVLFEAATAIGRVCMGLEAAEGPRYVAYGAVGVVGVYLAVREAPLPRAARVGLLSALVLFLGFKEFTSARENAELMNWYASGKRAWVDCYLAREDVDRCNDEAKFQIHPYPAAVGVAQKLAFLKAHGYSLFKRGP
jgi:hypothetical protein